MRQSRLKAPGHHPVAYYHCISRVVNRSFVLKDQEREMFVHFMRMYERLCGLRVVTFCVMSNHFHLLVEVPRRPERMPSEAELLTIITRSYGKVRAHLVAEEIQQFREAGAQDRRPPHARPRARSSGLHPARFEAECLWVKPLPACVIRELGDFHSPRIDRFRRH